MAVIADRCPNIKVYVVDKNIERINKWNSKELCELPIYEPGLEKIIQKCRGKNLFFSSDIEENIALAEIIFISVNTPTKKKGIGAGKASDLKWVEACAREVAKNAKNHTIVVEKSTLPVRTAEAIKNILEATQEEGLINKSKATFDILSNPEFLAEGSAIKDLEKPDRVLIGGTSQFAMNKLAEIYKNWVPDEKILFSNIWSSELAKLTANAFLAQRISSINSISALCEATGADVREVARAIGSDKRIGSGFLDSGPGFGGSCFKKDILNLVYLAKNFGLQEVSKFWEEVIHINNWHQHRVSKLVVKKLFGTVAGKKISILGFAFKANTNDTRESAAIQICKDLIEEGAFLSIHDPKVNKSQIEKDLNIKSIDNIQLLDNGNNLYPEGSWFFSNEIYSGLKNSDAILILTEWEVYHSINWKKVYDLMRKPAWLFDSRSIANLNDVQQTKLNFWRIGDGTLF